MLYECRLHFTKSVVLLNTYRLSNLLSLGSIQYDMIVMLNNTIEYDEVRFHERRQYYLSSRSFATKLASALDGAVVALILIISTI